MFRHGDDVCVKGLHNASIKPQTFPAAYHELPKDASLEEFCYMSYTGTRDVGTSKNGFRAHFKDPVHESISLHSSEHEPSPKVTHGDDTGHSYPSRFNGNDAASSSGVIPYRQNQKPVDSWIDELDFNSPDTLPRGGKDMSEMTMMWFIQPKLFYQAGLSISKSPVICHRISIH